MKQLEPVRFVNCGGDLAAPAHRFQDTRLAAAQSLRESLSLDVLSRNKYASLLATSGVVDRDDMGMLQSCGKPGLIQESLDTLVCPLRRITRNLQRDFTVQ